jgi:hypothetical protein
MRECVRRAAALVEDAGRPDGRRESRPHLAPQPGLGDETDWDGIDGKPLD